MTHDYLADMRADCITAAGAAVIAGLPEAGKVLAWIAGAPLDKLRGMRYTDIIKQPAQRAEKQEGKTMKNARAYFDKNGFIIGESAKFDFGKWHYRHERFTSWDAAETWLHTEEYDFRERELISLTTARKHGYKE